MNTSSLTLRVRLPRAWLLLAALFLPHLAFASYFTLPYNPVVGPTYPIQWSGPAFGSHTSIQFQSPGSSTWTTFGGGGISNGYSIIRTQFGFTATGSWRFRVINGSTGPVLGSTLFTVGVPVNQPPVPTISIDGHSSNQTVGLSATVTVRYGATDANGNLSGIRYNAWNATTGYFDNGGGYATQSGSSGLVIQSFTLSTAGEWYFWTEAQDTTGAYASTGQWASGFKINVSSTATPTLVPYEPWYWNDAGSRQRSNNCYNYSNNRVTNTFAQPGRASGNMYSAITASEVREGTLSDGLIPTTATAPIPPGYTRTALVIAPGLDYHWYRLDQGGNWSHKPGQTQATNVDNSGNIITNPETANRGFYTEFAGYFFTPVGTTQGAGSANIN